MNPPRRPARTDQQPSPAPVVGVIDIGTNSVKLTVGRVSRGRVAIVHVARETTRLGEGMTRTGRISTEAGTRTARVVRRMAGEARARGAHEVLAIGTFALRRATNGRRVARAIARTAGVEVRVLSGVAEARCSLAAVRARLDRPRPWLIVVDIGGGSTELIVARGTTVHTVRSLPIGALRLTERHLHTDPIAPGEHAAMMREINDTVARVFARIPRIPPASSQLVAVGGSATTALRMIRGVAIGFYAGGLVTRAELRGLETRCLELDLAGRRRLPGLPADRADIIPAGLAVLIAFARRTRKRSLIVSEGGVREGVILARSEPRARDRARTRSRARPAPARPTGR